MLYRPAAEPDLIALLRAIGFAAPAGCSSGGGQPLPHDGGADGSSDQLTTVSFVNDVHPIVAASCALVGCHDMSTDEPCQDPTHHRRMPPDPMAPLSAESIGKIVQWIREGALLN